MSDADDDEGNGTESEEGMRWAADEPTAMWDESLLQQEGFDALVKDRTSNPREETGPATVHQVGGATSSKVQVSADATGGHPKVAAGRRRRGAGMSWALTFALAIGLGFGVYLLVRLLR